MITIVTFGLLALFGLLFFAMAVTPLAIEEMERKHQASPEPISLEERRRARESGNTPQAA